jgi:antitoxin VapB
MQARRKFRLTAKPTGAREWIAEPKNARGTVSNLIDAVSIFSKTGSHHGTSPPRFSFHHCRSATAQIRLTPPEQALTDYSIVYTNGIYYNPRRNMETAKLFQNGKSQAVRLPKEFRFKGEKVFVKRMGSAVVLLPFSAPWQSLADSLSLFSSDFMETRKQPSLQKRKKVF